VTMSGHLHWLWWWALDTQPDGDLSAYDPEDIAEAAGWEGDAAVFVAALMNCGPGDKLGFIDPDMRLHDWDEYGGKYRKRSESARKAAQVRWESASNAETEPANAVALRSHSTAHELGNAEERRGEEKPFTLRTQRPGAGRPRPRNPIWDAIVLACGYDGKLTKSQQGRIAAAMKELADIGAEPAEILRRAAIYRIKYPGMDVTPTALSANWANIGTAPAGKFTDVGRGGVFFND